MQIENLDQLVAALQSATDVVFAGLPDRPRFRADGAYVWFDYEIWSLTLDRTTFTDVFPVDEVIAAIGYEGDGVLAAELGRLRRAADWTSLALPVVSHNRA